MLMLNTDNATMNGYSKFLQKYIKVINLKRKFLNYNILIQGESFPSSLFVFAYSMANCMKYCPSPWAV